MTVAERFSSKWKEDLETGCHEWTAAKERSARGRSLREAVLGTFPNRVGELNDNAKLTKDDIMEIRTLLNRGVKQTRIASLFDISQTQVSRINRRAAWKEVL